MPDDTTTRTCPGQHSTERPAPALRNDEYLCSGCVHRAERVLGDLPALAHDLEVTVSRQARTYRAAPRGGVPDEDWRRTDQALAPRPLPVDVATSERARTVCALLFEWADYIATWHRMKGMPVFAAYRPLTELVPQAVAILLSKTDWMRSNEQGPDLATAMHCVRRDLRNLIDTRPERLYAGPCHADLGYDPELGYRCELPIYREWGHDEITCDGHQQQPRPGRWYSTGCGSVHATSTRRDWLRAEIEERLLPLRLVWEDLHELVPGSQLEWKTVKQWTEERRTRVPQRDKTGRPILDQTGREKVRINVTPPRLEPQAWSGATPLFRGADILRLAEDKPARRGRRRRVARANSA